MKTLKRILAKKAGRSNGVVTVRHQGGREKRFLRTIDFKRDKKDVWGVVEKIEYDPNRNSEIALVVYEDGDRRYILSPVGLKVGSKVIASEVAPTEPGNALPLNLIPVGTPVHNIEVTKGKGGQIVKGAGSVAVIFGKEDNLSTGKVVWVLVKLPSGEIRKFGPECLAVIGQIGNVESKNEVIGKAGRNRHKGIRPSVRGVAMNPHSHPHGGGEGRSSVGMKYPKTFYGRKAVGKTRSKTRYSNRVIVQRRGGKSILG
ncbi:MAG: 50S ribosomal protein L2, large subunit ribosomal protein L2 [Microgenomates group bacterium GW2011_GWC1_41_20]|uniref:Large ribosomal subunit protein uL2 n=7 Tax=Candidatus Woeseibacteriota TaxID=1752722 RepID=A0A0G0V120_9BACT|nr:MAG: 50S ribosomal protein L2 [Candidatus Woesebacteria bacterium GW2011_GWB1_40_12]KKR56247.1 MAG: 50S ribosomal protein L2 [Candidatus Woesebacteria bacterium GW2011_GWF1_40_24]KKR90754.1 MAG: 50S ribosomal protein L2 [Candidatus Woesebacteria bacterium GW2011_GWD1_41_12]KKS00774.1 MAG: 50S ribosomal protein L2, large subunit ribosomal protein L2 [Microgenomates group bacterium GW2011_GWC1_41_20]KKS05787.1 MAG: 50S ribosomal protein L2 [Candidatus Woesebacteria bacterium GW2011_GWE1_41_24]